MKPPRHASSWVAVIAAVLAASTATAQESQTENTLTLAGADPAPAVIGDFAWLAGLWAGEAFGQTVQEFWSPPAAGTMVGAFKLYDGDEVSFYELLVLTEVGGSVAMRLKHFQPDLAGWEEKDVSIHFPLVRRTEDTYYFDGLTFARRGGDVIDVYLVVGEPDGSTREEHLVYRRQAFE